MKPDVLEAHGYFLDWLFAEDADDAADGNLDAAHGGAFTRENTLASRRADRDQYAAHPGSIDHADVLEFVEQSGLGAVVEQEFRRLISEEVRVRGREGSRVDVRNAIRRLAGDHAVDDVYERYETRQTGDRAVGVALDMSSSMSDVEREVKSALAAFATAVEAVGDEFVAAGYSSKSSRLITGPEERFRPHHLDAVQASGGTPTAAGVDDVLTLLSATRASEQLLFVVTDGAPTTMLEKDAFEESADEVEAMVDRARERGVDVVGVGIGDVRHSLMAQMFGRDSYTKTGISNLDDELTAAYRTQTSVTGGVA